MEQIVLRSWWVIVVALLCGIGYEQGLKHITLTTAKLDLQLKTLEREYQEALEQNTLLKLHINSQSDPAYVELALMKSLGVVPEGQTKVFFQQKETHP